MKYQNRVDKALGNLKYDTVKFLFKGLWDFLKGYKRVKEISPRARKKQKIANQKNSQGDPTSSL